MKQWVRRNWREQSVVYTMMKDNRKEKKKKVYIERWEREKYKWSQFLKVAEPKFHGEWLWVVKEVVNILSHPTVLSYITISLSNFHFISPPSWHCLLLLQRTLKLPEILIFASFTDKELVNRPLEVWKGTRREYILSVTITCLYHIVLTLSIYNDLDNLRCLSVEYDVWSVLMALSLARSRGS